MAKRKRPEASPGPDSGVQVVVRIRPLCEDGWGTEACVRKTANSITINRQDFTFDAVADSVSTQEDIFTLVGLPLVENCLSGFNSSIFAYGQTGTGKTHTMWGPLSALSEDSVSSERGLTPRVFEHLFSRINEEQDKHADKKLTYNCVCSFLEIYMEQITDLLDPSRTNLEIRKDVGAACDVKLLTKESVFTMKDVTQLLVKGLANRRTRATSTNADSSCSHGVFSCLIKSDSKNPEDGSSITRSSRITLVDLAGSERQQTHAFGLLKESSNINLSLFNLKEVINKLAEISQSGKQRHHVPYRTSKLTHLLEESLGGNAKLAMICAVSPSQSCKSETLRTLEFAQRAKAIKNNAIVNEKVEGVNALREQIKVEGVNALREQIRQLKEENKNLREENKNLRQNALESSQGAHKQKQESHEAVKPDVQVVDIDYSVESESSTSDEWVQSDKKMRRKAGCTCTKNSYCKTIRCTCHTSHEQCGPSCRCSGGYKCARDRYF